MDVRSTARYPASLPRRALLRFALAATVSLVVGLSPGLVPDRASAASVATGYLNFTNETDTTLWLAILYLNEEQCGTDGWMVEGWWELAPGESAAVTELGENTYFYYYADGEDGTTVFSGSHTTLVMDSVFARCKGTGTTDPDLYAVEMKQLWIDPQYTTYTMRLGGSARSEPFEPADQPGPDADGCTISGGVRLCPAYD